MPSNIITYHDNGLLPFNKRISDVRSAVQSSHEHYVPFANNMQGEASFIANSVWNDCIDASSKASTFNDSNYVPVGHLADLRFGSADWDFGCEVESEFQSS